MRPFSIYNQSNYQDSYRYPIPAQSHHAPTTAGESTLQESQHLERELRSVRAHRDVILDQWSEGIIFQRDITRALNNLSMYEDELQQQTRSIQMKHALAFQDDSHKGAVLVSDSGQPILELDSTIAGFQLE
jgi:hypothetical protein